MKLLNVITLAFLLAACEHDTNAPVAAQTLPPASHLIIPAELRRDPLECPIMDAFVGRDPYISFWAELDGFNFAEMRTLTFWDKLLPGFVKRERTLSASLQLSQGNQIIAVLPVFDWGLDDRNPNVRVNVSNAQQFLPDTVLVADGQITARFNARFSDQMTLQALRAAQQATSIAVSALNLQPGTHSVAGLFTRDVAVRADNTLSQVMTTEQWANLPPRTFPLFDTTRPCNQRIAGVEYVISSPDLPPPGYKATLRIKTKFRNSIFVPDDPTGKPTFAGRNPERLGQLPINIVSTVSNPTTGETQLIPGHPYIGELLTKHGDIYRSLDESFVRSTSTANARQQCELIRGVLPSIGLNYLDRIVLLSILVDRSNFKGQYELCLSGAQLGELASAGIKLEPAALGPITQGDRLIAALRAAAEASKGKTGRDLLIAQRRASVSILESLAASVQFSESVIRNNNRLLTPRRLDTAALNDIDAAEHLTQLASANFRCATAPTANERTWLMEAGGVGAISRVFFDEVEALSIPSSACYFVSPPEPVATAQTALSPG